MGQRELDRKMKAAMEKAQGPGLGDMEEQDYYRQIHPGISTPGHESEQKYPATVVVAAKENKPGWSDHGFDVMGRNIVAVLNATTRIATFAIPNRFVGVCQHFGWVCEAAGFGNVTFRIVMGETPFPSIPAATPNAYLPSGNSVDADMLAKCYETQKGTSLFAIDAINAAGVNYTVSARIVGYYYSIGMETKEMGDRIYASPDHNRM